MGDIAHMGCKRCIQSFEWKSWKRHATYKTYA